MASDDVGRVINVDEELQNADWTKQEWDLLGVDPEDLPEETPAVKFRNKRRLDKLEMDEEK